MDVVRKASLSCAKGCFSNIRRVSLSIVSKGPFLAGLECLPYLIIRGKGATRGLACFPLAAGGRRVAVGEGRVTK